MDNQLNQKILSQLKQRRISQDQIKSQIQRFKKGYPFINLVRPCTVTDGIIKLGNEEIVSFINNFNSSIDEIKVVKFVPASGAASRMFKSLLNVKELLSSGHTKNSIEKVNEALDHFISNIEKFAFCDDLDLVLKGRLHDLITSDNYLKILNALLDEEGLNYKNTPKGLIKFHRYNENSRTAFEEHLVEGSEYIQSRNTVNIHFTVQEEFVGEIEKQLQQFKKSNKFKGTNFNIAYSYQNPSTDTVAVDMNNSPVTDINGELVFRPGGHGALLNNLNELEFDLVFIKNIDNVTTETLLNDTVQNKKALGGYLLFVQEKIFKYLKVLTDRESRQKLLDEIIEFCNSQLSIKFDNHFYNSTENEKTDYLFGILNRPIRVCGVVRNEGEPGGGPFWVQDKNDSQSIQIVESAQVDMNSREQKDIWNSSTHFNPVDLVCGVRDFKGNKFNLFDFIDHEAGIITVKSYQGNEIKALELPGLWNGSMAKWITIFIEVPLITFNPVKTVFDLLRAEHQVISSD